MSKYYKVEDVLAIFSEEERPLNWTDSESEIQAQNDFDCYKGMIESLPAIEVNEDCISRKYLKSFGYINKGDFNSVETIREWIDNAPSVVPTVRKNRTVEQSSKVGEWKNTIGGIYACSNCKSSFTNIPKDGYWKPMWNYCPHCGAKMCLE